METYTFYAFNTDCQVYIEEAHVEIEVQNLFREIESWHHIFNVFDAESEVSRFNQAKTPFQGSPLFYRVLQEMMIYREKTKGYFDPFVEILFASLRKMGTVLAKEEETYRHLHQTGHLEFQKDYTINKSDSAIQVNFHSFLKGYACDYMRKYMYEVLDLRHFLIDFGGNILAEGMASEGSYWHVGIQHPARARGEVIHTLDLLNASLVTSGSYERPITIDGSSKSHLINSATGQFLPLNTHSVSVQALMSVEAEVLSTALFGCSKDEQLSFLQQFSAKAYIADNDTFEIYG